MKKDIENAYEIDNLKTVRQLQIIWLVADLNHHGHFNIHAIELESIREYLIRSTNSIQQYVLLYTKWWKTAYNTSDIDVISDIIVDMNLHCPRRRVHWWKFHKHNGNPHLL
jgi:hypothetical protein